MGPVKGLSDTLITVVGALYKIYIENVAQLTLTVCYLSAETALDFIYESCYVCTFY